MRFSANRNARLELKSCLCCLLLLFLRFCWLSASKLSPLLRWQQQQAESFLVNAHARLLKEFHNEAKGEASQVRLGSLNSLSLNCVNWCEKYFGFCKLTSVNLILQMWWWTWLYLWDEKLKNNSWVSYSVSLALLHSAGKDFWKKKMKQAKNQEDLFNFRL